MSALEPQADERFDEADCGDESERTRPIGNATTVELV